MSEENVNEEVVAEEVPEEEEEVEAEPWDSYKMPPDQELWEGGPNFKHINDWKDKYGDIYVTSLTPEKHFVWRTMYRPEYRQLVKTLETALSNGTSQGIANMDNEEAIVSLCMLSPTYDPNDPRHLAGTAGTISSQILEASGFVSLEVRQL